MKITIADLYRELQRMDAAGLLAADSEIVGVYRPHEPLAATAVGFGWIDRLGRLELVLGCGLDGGRYADSLQEMAFAARGGELAHEPEDWS